MLENDLKISTSPVNSPQVQTTNHKHDVCMKTQASQNNQYVIASIFLIISFGLSVKTSTVLPKNTNTYISGIIASATTALVGTSLIAYALRPKQKNDLFLVSTKVNCSDLSVPGPAKHKQIQIP